MKINKKVVILPLFISIALVAVLLPGLLSGKGVPEMPAGGDNNIPEDFAAIDDDNVEFVNNSPGDRGDVVEGAEASVNSVKAYFTPEDFGAVGDGVADDTAAIQAAIDYISNNLGGGILKLPNRYGFSGVIKVKEGVILEGVAVQQQIEPEIFPWDVPGLVAIAPGAQLLISTWTPRERAGGVKNLIVDGADIGGQAPTSGLVRIEGVTGIVENLYCHRSAGDGIVYNGYQNSVIIGGMSTFHAGCALVIDNGAGALSFQGGYYGTSFGGAFLCRDTPGEINLYPFGPTNVTFDGAIFESYNTGLHERHMHISGTQIMFTNCNFTGGADNKNKATILIDNSASLIPSTVIFDSCLWWTFKDHDAVRLVGPQWAFCTGLQHISDDGKNHTPSFLCFDGGAPHVAILGEVHMAGQDSANRVMRTINGASYINCYNFQDTGVSYRLRQGQQVSIQTENDTQYRLAITREGGMIWGDGAGNMAGSLSNYNQTLATTGIFNIRDGFQFEPVTISNASGAISCNTAQGHTFELRAALNAAMTVTLLNPSNGREIELAVLGNGNNTLDFATPVKWIGGNAPAAPRNGEWLILRFIYLNDTWIGGLSMS